MNFTLLEIYIQINISKIITKVLAIKNCTSLSYLLSKMFFSFSCYSSNSNRILHKSDSINNTGYLVWELVLVLTAAWVVCFLALFRGVKMSGKIVYFTAIFPYLVLLILGIYGWTLEGADLGVYYFIYPDMEKLKDVIIWKEAAVQVFFTLSLSYGGNIALASYNNFQNNILR